MKTVFNFCRYTMLIWEKSDTPIHQVLNSCFRFRSRFRLCTHPRVCSRSRCCCYSRCLCDFRSWLSVRMWAHSCVRAAGPNFYPPPLFLSLKRFYTTRYSHGLCLVCNALFAHARIECYRLIYISGFKDTSIHVCGFDYFAPYKCSAKVSRKIIFIHLLNFNTRRFPGSYPAIYHPLPHATSKPHSLKLLVRLFAAFLLTNVTPLTDESFFFSERGTCPWHQCVPNFFWSLTTARIIRRQDVRAMSQLLQNAFPFWSDFARRLLIESLSKFITLGTVRYRFQLTQQNIIINLTLPAVVPGI